ncbi:DUF397 domain-containing protein [Saccharothrix sp.]|uniref:DUF397 domain-containing protein n=1 Tax=Saccharothrix sp. TaxID=1873460 RepID=UPI0028127BFB|nr:DUF397 domain-containing protein [Saccharothrix sp.]
MWRKSSRSGGAQNCVEVARSAERAAVRDTKRREAGTLVFRPVAFQAFLNALKR